MKRIRKLLSIFTLLSFVIQTSPFAAEVLVDSGQRQTVLERTKQYAGNLDAVSIRTNANLSFQKNLKVHTGGSTSGFSAKCGGYTASSCGIPCCGEKECSSVCTANMSVAHGNTCLSDYTTSWCGMSCCGKEDCDRVCYNYRTTTASVENCGGYIKTATGESCCGLEDCRKKNCGSYTSVITADFGTEEKCCGEKNCLDVKCDYNHSTEVITGGTAKCCGTKDCYSKYCEEITEVNSKVYPDKKNLECCGKSNCHLVECDGYVQTNSPTGIQQCCGYEDCRNKECGGAGEGFRYVTLNGQKKQCCGHDECGQLLYKKYFPNDIFVCDFGTHFEGYYQNNPKGKTLRLTRTVGSGTPYIYFAGFNQNVFPNGSWVRVTASQGPTARDGWYQLHWLCDEFVNLDGRWLGCAFGIDLAHTPFYRGTTVYNIFGPEGKDVYTTITVIR